MNSDLSALAHFSGIARLFPLPNLVQFPHVVQPLHMFEARYRRMTADALAGDRLLAMALLRPGWEADYERRPPIYPVACLGRIVLDHRLPDGRYNLLLRGLSRVRVLEELKDDRPYRSARVELLTELPAAADIERGLRARLGAKLPDCFPAQAPALEQLQKLMKANLPLGMLADIFIAALPLEPAFKQQLLETLSVEVRLGTLLDHLGGAAPPGSDPPPEDRKFPPNFSPN
jgi:Lon protease-like protein